MEATLPPSSLLARPTSYRDGCTSTWRRSPLYSAERSSEGQSLSVCAPSSSLGKRVGNPPPRDRRRALGAHSTRRVRSPPSRERYSRVRTRCQKSFPDQDATCHRTNCQHHDVGASPMSPDRATRSRLASDTPSPREQMVLRTCGVLNWEANARRKTSVIVPFPEFGSPMMKKRRLF